MPTRFLLCLADLNQRSFFFLQQVHGLKEFSVATIASNGAPGGAAGALKVGDKGALVSPLQTCRFRTPDYLVGGEMHPREYPTIL